MPAKEKLERYKGYNVKTEAAESHPKFLYSNQLLVGQHEGSSQSLTPGV